MLNTTFRRGVFLALTAATLVSMAPSYGQSTYFIEGNKTIKTLGVQGQFYYVGFVEPLGQACLYNLVYIAADYKGVYSHLLAAMLAGKHISRIDYNQLQGNGTQCEAQLVEITN